MHCVINSFEPNKSIVNSGAGNERDLHLNNVILCVHKPHGVSKHVEFGFQFVQIGPKWDKSETF